MISKDSETTKEFVKSIFKATHKRYYVEHALNMIKTEENMKSIIFFLSNNPNATWQDIEYHILLLV